MIWGPKEVDLGTGDGELSLSIYMNDVLSPPARGLLKHGSDLGCRMATMG